MLLRLIDAQRARKIAEEDKKRLNNRVKQLLKEEEKAKKRISETKKRAEEILSLKRRNELRVREKQAQRQEMEEHIIVLNKNKVKLKADHAKKKDRAHRDLVRVKKQLSQETRNESMQHERALHQQRKLAQRRALETRESIRKSKSEAAAKLAKMKVKHMSNVKEDYLGRLDTELSHLRATEEELNSMTMLEMELIQRLQDKQREQENAYTKLEQVLGIAQHTKAGSPQARKGAPPPVSAATSVAPSPMAPQARLKRPGTADSPAPPAAAAGRRGRGVRGAHGRRDQRQVRVARRHRRRLHLHLRRQQAPQLPRAQPEREPSRPSEEPARPKQLGSDLLWRVLSVVEGLSVGESKLTNRTKKKTVV